MQIEKFDLYFIYKNRRKKTTMLICYEIYDNNNKKKNKEKLLLYIHNNMYIYIKTSKQIIEIYLFFCISIHIYKFYK